MPCKVHERRELLTVSRLAAAIVLMIVALRAVVGTMGGGEPLGGTDGVTIVVIEAVPFREEILERTLGRGERVTRGFVQVVRRMSRSACAPIVHGGITRSALMTAEW
jgi:hypothetical protein